MGSQLGDGVVVERGAIVGARALVEPGTVVKAGHIWAGRPATEFRPVKPEEADFFRMGKEVYVGYARNYLKQTRAA
jgi:carbonic anhydrase/acetyltransferase-like protein (isoleucine patch superfamily)